MGEFSYRNFKIGEQFRKEFKDCSRKKDKHRCEIKVREKYRMVESNRFHQMADKIHKFISHLDRDEIIDFKRKFPKMTKIANEFATVEELGEF